MINELFSWLIFVFPRDIFLHKVSDDVKGDKVSETKMTSYYDDKDISGLCMFLH